jgi:hypothetical protein
MVARERIESRTRAEQPWRDLAGAAISNRYALAALTLSLAVQLATSLVSPLSAALRVVPLTAMAWVVVLSASAVPAVAGQALHVWRSS